jgi:hypothetical protein
MSKWWLVVWIFSCVMLALCFIAQAYLQYLRETVK